MQSYDIYAIYELMITPSNKKAEMLIDEIMKKDKANLNLVRDLITLGANLDWQHNDGWTALHYCAYNNHLDIARMLLDAGADVNIQNEYGSTALHVSVRHNHPEIARMEIAKMLIYAGADVNIQRKGGRTALHWCARANHPEIARMLIDAGADKTIQDNDGILPYEFVKIQMYV